MVNEWVNYGDVNPIEHGGIFVKKDGDTTYRIVRNMFDHDEGKNIVYDMYVDISEDWIERESVLKFSDLKEDSDEVWFAIACTEYYSCINFDCIDYVLVTLEDTAKYLATFGIHVEGDTL